MSDKFIMSSRQAAELDFAFERNGWTSANVKALSSGDILGRLLPLLLGQAEITTIKHLIDLDADAFIPYKEWKVEEHIKGGQFEWNSSKVRIYLSENQVGGKSIKGNSLYKEVAKEAYNANLLDYLMRHPHLIPEDWKKDEKGNIRYIYFWGTIYRDSDGHLFVRCLCFDGGRWRTDYGWLGRDWLDGGRPAALRAS